VVILTREEILKRMAKGAELLEQDNLTPELRVKYQSRYDELESALKALNNSDEVSRTQHTDPVKTEIKKIRGILGMDKPKKKQRAR